MSTETSTQDTTTTGPAPTTISATFSVRYDLRPDRTGNDESRSAARSDVQTAAVAAWADAWGRAWGRAAAGGRGTEDINVEVAATIRELATAQVRYASAHAHLTLAGQSFDLLVDCTDRQEGDWSGIAGYRATVEPCACDA